MTSTSSLLVYLPPPGSTRTFCVVSPHLPGPLPDCPQHNSHNDPPKTQANLAPSWPHSQDGFLPHSESHPVSARRPRRPHPSAPSTPQTHPSPSSLCSSHPLAPGPLCLLLPFCNAPPRCLHGPLPNPPQTALRTLSELGPLLSLCPQPCFLPLHGHYHYRANNTSNKMSVCSWSEANLLTHHL